MDVEGDVVLGAEVGDELLVGVGFRSTEAVMDVDGGEADTEGVVFGVICCVEGEEESYGVGSARDGCADAIAGVDVFAGEG
jgi:hypothetical protein